jgi:hypothetical protein
VDREAGMPNTTEEAIAIANNLKENAQKYLA